MPELINMGSLQLKFLHSKHDTGGSLDMFAMKLHPNAACRCRIITRAGTKSSMA